MEFHKVCIDDDTQKATMDLSGEIDVVKFDNTPDKQYVLQFEYGKWMIEGKQFLTKIY